MREKGESRLDRKRISGVFALFPCFVVQRRFFGFFRFVILRPNEELIMRLGLLAVLVAAVLMACGCSTGSKSTSGLVPMPSGAAPAMAASGGTPAAVRASSEATDGTLVPAQVGVPSGGGIVESSYLIGPGDLLEIEVFKVEDLLTKARVNSAGMVAMPLVGPVRVGGMTPEEAGQRIAAELQRDHLQNQQVSVLVLEYANLNVTVGGAVKKPGVFPMMGKTTLLQAISLAEGVTDVANPEEVIVFRSLPDQSMEAYVVDLKQVQRGELQDPLLAVNDKVMVPESGSKVFVRNFTGAVRGFVSFNPLFY
jgi:polysaccharide export outer membrane protein